jgi:hypothetical protein
VFDWDVRMGMFPYVGSVCMHLFVYEYVVHLRTYRHVTRTPNPPLTPDLFAVS